MPYIHIDCETAPYGNAKRELALAVGHIYAREMQIDARIVNIAFRELGSGNIVRLDGESDSPRPITIVSCDVRRGRTSDQRTALGRALAAACARALGTTDDRVIVYITEHEASEIYRDGGAAPEWRNDEGPRSAV